jgi:wobble nucleotide-excising tRNase
MKRPPHIEHSPGTIVIQPEGQSTVNFYQSIHQSAMREEVDRIIQHIRSQAAVIPQEQKQQYQKALQAAQELESAIREDQPNQDKIEHSAKDLRAIAQTVTAIAPVIGELIKKLWP